MTVPDKKDNPQKILVVDDEPAVREFVERALAHAGYSVVSAPDGNAAMQILANKKFDLLLTDIVMPDLDGIALSLKVAKDFPGTKIMMMSGYANQRQRAHNLDFLTQEVISKPFTLDEITKRVKAVLAA
ncbi:MAG: response regulator [Proteobacteria bacterium]|nr:response regulator [Pseudomonadota bacterium]